MDEEQQNELKALVVGFLQQNLQENPQGLSIREFERTFPAKTDEPVNWYTRYGKKSVSEALECIPDTVRISYDTRFNTKIISLNQRSEKVDSHLVDLITHQRASGKRKSHRPSHRALVSFSLNRQYSNHGRRSTYTTRINHDQQYKGENLYNSTNHSHSNHRRESSRDVSSSAPFRPSIYSKPPPSKMAINDPRARASGIAPPQVKLGPSPYSRSSTASSITQNSAPPASPKPAQTLPSSTIVPRVRPLKSETVDQASKIEEEENPALISKKHHIRQRICSLLTRKYPEIKILHLVSLYQLEYDESLDAKSLGYQHLTFLLQDPLISPYIQINLKSPFPTITLKYGSQASGKENMGAKGATMNGDSKTSTQPISASKFKLDAIDRFNTKAMTQCLESLGPMKEPPIGNLEVEDQVKYKTMRMIFKDPNLTLKLEDWPKKFDQETKLKIRIRDYGFKTLFDFFKHLALELPITVKLNKDEDWIAVGNMAAFSDWLYDCMDKGKYRAITAMEAYYEMVAFPEDPFRFATAKDIAGEEYHPAYILSIKRTNLWLQLRTSQRIEEHLCVEASMTCYEDYKNRDLLVVPKAFVRPGFPCAVFDPTQQRWCRALILKAPEKINKNCEVSALLVDYAVTRSYVLTDLLCLMKRHLDLPVGPIYTKLAGVDDSNMVASSRIKCVLHEYTSPPVTLACKFLRGIPSKEPQYLPQICFEVALVDTRSGEDCNLAEDINLPPNSD